MVRRRPPPLRRLQTFRFTPFINHPPNYTRNFHVSHRNSISPGVPRYTLDNNYQLFSQSNPKIQQFRTSSEKSIAALPGFKRHGFNTKDPAERKNSDGSLDEGRRAQGEEETRNAVECEVNRASKTIHISNISVWVSWEEVLRCCSVYGEVDSIKIFKSFRVAGICFCFVKYREKNHAEVAVKRLGGTRRWMRVWRVGWAKKDVQEIKDQESYVKGKPDLQAVKEDFIIKGVENVEIADYMDKSWMVVTERFQSMMDVRKIIEEEGLEATTLIRWGLYGMIVVCKDKDSVKKWEDNVNSVRRRFVKVFKMNAKEMHPMRYCWIEVRGIPIQAWAIETMENVASALGNLLAIDKETHMAQRIDIARLFIETEEVGVLDSEKVMEFKAEKFSIKVSEIEREDNMECFHSQESSFRKQASPTDDTPLIAQTSQERGDKEGMVLGDRLEDNMGDEGILSPRNGAGKFEEILSPFCTSTTDKKFDEESSSIGALKTQVEETQDENTNFPTKSEGKSGKVPSTSSENGCSCCSFYKKKKILNTELQENKVEYEWFQNSSLVKEGREWEYPEPSNRKHAGRGKGKCLLTPLKQLNAVRGGGISKGVRRGGKKNQREDRRRKGQRESIPHLNDSTEQSEEVVRKGLESSEDIRFRFEGTMAKKLDFQSLMQTEFVNHEEGKVGMRRGKKIKGGLDKSKSKTATQLSQ